MERVLIGMTQIWDNIVKFFTNIKDFYYNLKYYIKNIIKWSPTLWNDRDWDHSYIFEVLKFKIEQTSKYINKHKRYEGYERDVERMNLCVRLINKYLSSDYEVEYQDYYNNPHSFSFMYKGEVEFNTLSKYFAKYPNDARKIKAKYPKGEIHNALMLGSYRQNRVKELIFKLLNNNIEKWWD